MARKKKYTAKEKQMYGIYKKAYHRAIKGHRYEYRERFTLKEFKKWYKDAKLAPDSKAHPIKSIIESQKYSDHDEYIDFARVKLGGKLTKEFRDPKTREDMWVSFMEEYTEAGMTWAEAKAYALEYFGY